MTNRKVHKEIEIVCNWPNPILSPNKKVHWAQKARAAKIYRSHAYLMAREAIVRKEVNEPHVLHALSEARKGDFSLSVCVTFCPPDKRHRDRDNMIASFKSGQDGIADALLINDVRFEPTYLLGIPVKIGRAHV